MDPEKQPLLNGIKSDLRRRRLRPLTPQEVLEYRNKCIWRQARFSLIFIFWSLIAMSLAALTSILVMAPKCVDTGLSIEPTVSPVHLSLVPLIYEYSTSASSTEQMM